MQSNIPYGHQMQDQMQPSQFQSSPQLMLSKLQNQMQIQSVSQSQPELQSTLFNNQQQRWPLNPLASSYPQPLGPQNHEFGSQRVMQQRHQMSATSLRAQQSQPVLPNASSATNVTIQTQSATLADWYNGAYNQIQLMRETYLPQLLIYYKEARGLCLKQSDGELATKNPKVRVMVEQMIKFLQIPRSEIARIPREKLSNYMRMVKYSYSKLLNNSVSLRSKKPQPNLHTGSRFNPVLAQSSTFPTIGSTPNSTNSLPNGQQYTSSLPQQTNEVASIKQRTWRPRGRPVTNAPQITWSTPPKPNSSPGVFVSAPDPNMSALTTTPHSIPSLQTPHIEKTNQSLPLRVPLTQICTSSLPNSPSPSRSLEPAGPEENSCGVSSVSIAGPEKNPETMRSNMEGGQQSHTTKQPIERLVNAVKSISPEALAATFVDMKSVVSMIDGMTGLDEVPPGRTRFGIQFANDDLPQKERKRKIFVMPLTDSSPPSCQSDSTGRCRIFDTESTSTSNIKKPKIEIVFVSGKDSFGQKLPDTSNLLEEIKDINRKLVETTLELDFNTANNIERARAINGNIVRCSYNGIGFAKLFRLHHNHNWPQMLPNLFVRLLVPTDYPNSSPTLLDALTDGSSENPEDLTEKVKIKFVLSLRKLPDRVSLREMARTWDACARAVFTEFSDGIGGKSFSSRYGNWENCITAI